MFERASEVLEIDLVHLVKEGSAEEVNDTFNAQALTMVLTVAIGKALMAQGKKPDALIGFSLGEISALALAGILSLDDASSCCKVQRERDGLRLVSSVKVRCWHCSPQAMKMLKRCARPVLAKISCCQRTSTALVRWCSRAMQQRSRGLRRTGRA